METQRAIETQSVHAKGKTFGVRAAAFIIDSIVINATTIAISLIVGLLAAIALALGGREFSLDTESAPLVTYGVGIGRWIMYYSLFEWLYGATPGKLVLRMRVIKTDGSPCDLPAALVRALLRLVDGLFFGLIAYSNMKAPRYQRVGDLAAKTIVADSNHATMRHARSWWGFLVAAGLYLVISTWANLLLIIAWLR